MVYYQASILFVAVVAEDRHGTLFNGSDVSMVHEVTKVQFSGLDWEYGRPQNGPEYLMASGPSTEDVTVAVSRVVSILYSRKYGSVLIGIVLFSSVLIWQCFNFVDFIWWWPKI